MLQLLLESGAPRRVRSAGWTMASVMTHAAIVTAAIAATSQAITGIADDPSAIPDVRYVKPAMPQPRDEPRTAPARSWPVPAVHDIPPIAIPSIPTVDVAAPFSDDIVRILGPGIATPNAPRGTPSGGIHTDVSVDRIVLSRPGNSRPDYPDALRSAALEGDVLVAFVVDSLGLVETRSIRILESTHDLFSEAVRRWLPRTRYIPAEVRGTRVRQLVQQRVGFTIRR
jgi:TonB family protein